MYLVNQYRKKVSDKIQLSFMIRTLKKCKIKSFLNLIQIIFKKPNSNHILSKEKLNASSPHPAGNKTRL